MRAVVRALRAGLLAVKVEANDGTTEYAAEIPSIGRSVCECLRQSLGEEE